MTHPRIADVNTDPSVTGLSAKLSRLALQYVSTHYENIAFCFGAFLGMVLLYMIVTGMIR